MEQLHLCLPFIGSYMYDFLWERLLALRNGKKENHLNRTFGKVQLTIIMCIFKNYRSNWSTWWDKNQSSHRSFLCVYSLMTFKLKYIFFAHFSELLTVWKSMNCNTPGSSVHRILQARTLKSVAIHSPGDLPDPGIESRFPELEADPFLSKPPGKPCSSQS